MIEHLSHQLPKTSIRGRRGSPEVPRGRIRLHGKKASLLVLRNICEGGIRILEDHYCRLLSEIPEGIQSEDQSKPCVGSGHDAFAPVQVDPRHLRKGIGGKDNLDDVASMMRIDV